MLCATEDTRFYGSDVAPGMVSYKEIPVSKIKKRLLTSYGYRYPLRVLLLKESELKTVVDGNTLCIGEIVFNISEVNGEQYVLGHRYYALKPSQNSYKPQPELESCLMEGTTSTISDPTCCIASGSNMYNDMTEVAPEPKSNKKNKRKTKKKTKKTSRKKKEVIEEPSLDQEDLLRLCSFEPSFQNTGNIIDIGGKEQFYNFFRGIQVGESRASYVFSVAKELGGDVLYDSLITIPSNTSIMYKFSDGLPAVGVFRSVIPSQLSDHFFHIAHSMYPQMKSCLTRRVRTLHLGAKEYNPNENQLPYYNNQRRVWTMDAGNTKKQTQVFLPELEFVEKFTQSTFKESHREKIEKVAACFRLGGTCFTRAAVNFGECQLHRDSCLGLDIIIYGGNWVGGELVIPQLKLKIKLSAGDIVVMDSYLFHEVLTSRGHRYSMVFFTKTHNQMSDAGELAVPKNLHWLSQKNFGEFSN